MNRISVEVRKFETIGYGNTRVPQVEAIVRLHGDDGHMTMWQESSAAGFAIYGANQVAPAAKRYAKRAAELLGLEPPVTWSPRRG